MVIASVVAIGLCAPSLLHEVSSGNGTSTYTNGGGIGESYAGGGGGGAGAPGGSGGTHIEKQYNYGSKPDTAASATNGSAVVTITQRPCSALQIGGSNNQATGGNCATLPLQLTPSPKVVLSDRLGSVETIITISPNQSVPAPFDLVLDFDKLGR